MVNHLPRLLRQRGMTWTDLARRTLLSRGHVDRLRAPRANPRLEVADRVATALGVPVEAVWQLEDPAREPA